MTAPERDGHGQRPAREPERHRRCGRRLRGHRRPGPGVERDRARGPRPGDRTRLGAGRAHGATWSREVEPSPPIGRRRWRSTQPAADADRHRTGARWPARRAPGAALDAERGAGHGADADLHGRPTRPAPRCAITPPRRRLHRRRSTLGVDAAGAFTGSLALAPGTWDVAVTPTAERAGHTARDGPAPADGLSGTLRLDGGDSYLEVDQDGVPVAGVSGSIADDGEQRRR